MGCETFTPFKKGDPPPFREPLPQPPIIDPIELIVDGDGTQELVEQSHIKPFFFILITVLIVCFIPYIYIKLKPHAQKLYACRIKPYVDKKLCKDKDHNHDDKKT
jgi:hypothetical protein